jgi:hypothetical protein
MLGILGILVSAVVMEGDSEFPGWGNMIVCVLAALIPMAIVNAFLPSALFAVGALVGAFTGGVAISWRCGMSFKRASIAAGIWLAVEIGLGLAFSAAT